MGADRSTGALDGSDFLPPPGRRSLPQLARAAEGCEGCELFAGATQVVFGEGPADARMVLVGEQPGDQEDQQGRPFVGPAGRLLAEGLEAAGIVRDEVYVTNAVKHFYFVERGKRRLHQKPKVRHVRACEPWLRCELDAIRPRVTVALGATAGLSLLGAKYRLTQQRGLVLQSEWVKGAVVGTIHPSALLRMPSHLDRDAAFAEFVRDLKVAKAAQKRG
ncbi:MAG TPA: UdgX family uracil-DNA binding protein [Phycisphaerales bacterium]|nr:UdgX family uracil-DNA binding protein [Phycisphaerales bacterium]